ncbi:MAG: ADP-ribosylglycohydrolase family protein [bacterium]|jgi:ADP-ribosylglycohydrolase
MLGAYIGDIVGSVCEWNNIKTKDFPFFNRKCFFTDDSVMTCAVALAIREYIKSGRTTDLAASLVREMQRLGWKYPDAGYGGMFRLWLGSPNPRPYNSFGNGSAMRVAAAGWYADSLADAEALAKASAGVTHDHPEGIKGAQATAASIFMARSRASISEIRSYLQDKYYDLNFTLDEIRDSYKFNETCQGTVPQALVAFFESKDFEDAVRNAISLGGDSDTLAAITGSIAEAYYGIPDAIKEAALTYLDDELKAALLRD